MDHLEAYKRLKEEAAKTLKMYALSGKVSEEFLAALRDYLNSLPEKLKNTYIIIIGERNIVVKRSELYDYAVRDPDFAIKLAKVLSS